MTKKIHRHWGIIAWQLPLLLPFAFVQLVLEALTTASWFVYCIADKARDSWLELHTRMSANLPPMYSRENNFHD